MKPNDTTPGYDAERAALWNLSATFERTLVTPFRTDYAEVLAAAKARLAPQGKLT